MNNHANNCLLYFFSSIGGMDSSSEENEPFGKVKVVTYHTYISDSIGPSSDDNI